MNHLEFSRQKLSEFINSRQEWLLQSGSGKTFALDKNEIEIEIKLDKLLFGFLDGKGFQMWRVKKYEIEDGKLNLDLTRNFERDSSKITLVARVSAKDLSESVELARLEKAGKIAAIIIENQPKSKLVRVRLNKENGRAANFLFENPNKVQIAAIADVSDSLSPEVLISTAIFQLSRLQNRKKNPIDTLWILSEKKQAKKLQRLHALLNENWKRSLKIFEFSNAEDETNLKKLENLKIERLWSEKAGKIHLPEKAESTRTAREIIKIAPEKIDVVFSKQGETLRFLGLPFARVRQVLDEEKLWFGVEKEKQILSKSNERQFFELVENLEKYRRADSPNKRHVFYTSAPEAWLEAILRRNIKLLDANLILSPLYHQFRAELDKIDLLALRKDGRLIIIEVKTAPDREMIFQAADYWRKIELQRRKGNLQKLKIFDDLTIADKPAICYLVAPTLAFHRDFNFLSQTISKKIEMHKFNLAENWRENLKVLNRN
jgi:hypothetical protein